MSDENGIIVAGAKLTNFAGFDKFECKFNSGVTYLYGKNGAGKTTVGLSGLQACINGIAEQGDKFKADRFICIGKAGKSADIEYEFKDKSTGETFFIKNHITKASNSITFRKGDGSIIDDSWLKNFLNVALLSAKNFCAMSGKNQAVALGIDTSTFDKNIVSYKEERKLINRLIKEEGKIDIVEKVDEVDIEGLKKLKTEFSNELNQRYLENKKYNKELQNEYEANKADRKAEITKYENQQRERQDHIVLASDALSTLNSLGYAGDEVRAWVNTLPKPEEKSFPEINEPKYIEEMPGSEPVDEIDRKIADAYDTNAKAKAYKEYLNKRGLMEQREAELAKIQDKIKSEEEDRVNYIKQKDFGFMGMGTDENGCLTYNDRPINESYYSKGELEIIVAKLAVSMNPIFKTRFIDEFGVLDSENQEKLINHLLENDFQVIVAVPGENVSHENALVLRECKLINGEEEKKENLL